MNARVHEQERQPGGRFGRKVAAATPPAETASEKLARLDELRRANGGLLVPMPASAAGACYSLAPDGHVPNAAMRGVLAWLDAIVEAGGSPMDVELAWSQWQPDGLPYFTKIPAMNHYEAAVNAAGPAWLTLLRRAEAEQEPARQLALIRQRVGAVRAKLADADRKLDPLRAELVKEERVLARHLDQYPHLKDAGHGAD